MANNTTLSAMAGGDVIATRDFNAYKVPRGLTGFLNALANDVEDVSASNPLPTYNPNPQEITGTVAVSNFPATQTVAGSVAVSNFPASQTVAGSVAVSNFPASQTVAGSVAVSSLPSLPTGANTIGIAISPQQTGVLYSGGTPITPKFAPITATSLGSTNLVAAVAGKKIRVLKAIVSYGAQVQAKFVSNGTTPTDLTGLFYGAANAGFGLSYAPVGSVETLAGEPLAINLSAAAPVGGVLTYIEV